MSLDFDKMNSIVDSPLRLSSDYEKLYESGKYTDISINVGREPNSRVFHAHALVLRARSTFLESNLTNNTGMDLVIKFEDITPDIFEILLRFIYTGRMSYDPCKNINWISLLNAVGMFELHDLFVEIESYLITTQTEWIQRNILTVRKYALSAGFSKLLDYCDRAVALHPEAVFSSNDIASLPKEAVITFLKNDNLDMCEDDIWLSVVRWAIKQPPELGNDPDSWTSNDISRIMDITADCIPHIRFHNISLKTIALYDDLLPRKLRRDLLNYHAEGNYTPNMLPPVNRLRCVDSHIINEYQVEWISSKIMESRASKNQDGFCKFTLLYRQSRDGDYNSVAKFRELCNNKGATIAVGKVCGTGEILGGYNPTAWGQNCYVSTEESFIFALDIDNLSNSIVSFVDDSKYAIHDDDECFPCFGSFDLFFGDQQCLPSAERDAYNVPLRVSTNDFEWVDWEVFSVLRV